MSVTAPSQQVGRAPRESSSDTPLLETVDLRVVHRRGGVDVVLLDGISLQIRRGEIFGLVGESGSGKTISALATIRLLPEGIRAAGSVRLEGQELTQLSEAEMRDIRGAKISMIFQEPTAALNPVFTIGSQITAAIRAHLNVGKAEAQQRGIELLGEVGIPDPIGRMSYYPHQLSGGMCQRVMIAMALAAGARLVIADEPTTALDVTIQAEIVKLLERLVRDTGIGLLFISHDLGLVAQLCDRLTVAYAGEAVEMGDTAALLRTPMHPYTRGLVKCVTDFEHVGQLHGGIPGAPPLPGSWPNGCRFQARCEFATAGCERRQELRQVEPGHLVRCWRAETLLASDTR
jgi:peptide/nickel transport system ATP-binding protein